MADTTPSFLESVREAEKRLSRVLNGRCEIAVHHGLDENLMKVVQTIDHEKFRQELWYSRDEFDSRRKKRGFLCLVASLDGRAIAFDYGYEDEEEGTYYSDTTATLIEGKRVGSTLFSLEIIHSYQQGYRYTKLSTEEVDEKGRPLTLIWGRLGFRTVSKDSSEGVEMRLTHTPQRIRSLYENYISDNQPSE
ncbi:MAG TPA: hypothetical protein VM050_09870 [Patescibacteria group bacterium]|nr:hypothetical protein [Patescibacteria group bacterium]